MLCYDFISLLNRYVVYAHVGEYLLLRELSQREALAVFILQGIAVRVHLDVFFLRVRLYLAGLRGFLTRHNLVESLLLYYKT